MDLEELLIGLGLVSAAFLYYWILIKDQPPSSERTNWNGPTQANYIGLWGSVILLALCGIAYIFSSL